VETTYVKSFVKKIKAKETHRHKMSFMDHLEVLRWHIIRSAIAVVAASVLVFIFIDWVFDNVIYAPRGCVVYAARTHPFIGKYG
jgi:sec-independent protein translocase protein TatC